MTSAPAPRADRDLPFAALAGIASLAPRLYVALAWAREPVWDGHYYDFGARRIASGMGYSDDVLVGGVARWHPWCHYPPGYSGFLAGIYKLFGDGIHTAPVANAVIGALIVVLTHQLALHGLSKQRARAAALLCALHPGLILYSGLVMTELLSAVLPMLALWAAFTLRDKRPWIGAVAAGVAMGLATLVSPPNLVLAPAVALALLPPALSLQQSVAPLVARAAVVCAAAVAVVVPWTLRNCKVMDGCAFVSTNGGWNLAIGSFSRATGRFETLRASDGCEVVTGQVQQDRCWAEHGVQAIRKDPWRWLQLGPKKLDYSFSHESFPVEYLKTGDKDAWPEERRTWWREKLTAFHRVLMSVSPFGLLALLPVARVREAVASRRWRDLLGPAVELAAWVLAALVVYWAWRDDTHTYWPLALLLPVLALVPRSGGPRVTALSWFIGWALLSFDVVHVVFFGEDRYHIPLVPLLCVLAASVGRVRGSRAATVPARDLVQAQSAHG